MKRFLLLVVTVWIVILFAIPHGDAGAMQKPGKGKGGGGEKTILEGRLTLDDAILGATLLSDGKAATRSANLSLTGRLTMASNRRVSKRW